jgi:glycosyltransferase involved in cell wall biosynthesis
VTEARKVKVLRLFSRLNIGGPSFHVIHLASGLSPLGYETLLVVGRESGREGNLLDLASERGVEVLQMESLGREVRLLQDARTLVELIRLLRRFRPDIVHTHTAKAGLVGRLAARLAGVPVILHTYHGHVLRGYFGPAKTLVFRQLERFLGRASHAVIAVSQAVERDLLQLGVVRPGKIRVIPLGLELRPLAGELPRGALRGPAGVPDDAALVGIVGRLVPIKDVPTFLRAAGRVVETAPSVYFAVVGDGDERAALEAQARELGLSERVHFHGWQRDMRSVYGDLDLVVNCSRNEGTPVALIEALAAGRPVVATRVGGTPDVLGDGAFGELVAPEDPEALAAAILRSLDARGEARARAENGRAHVLERHSVERLVADVDALYRELLGTRGAA